MKKGQFYARVNASIGAQRVKNAQISVMGDYFYAESAFF
jgi:hypothetical protein